LPRINHRKVTITYQFVIDGTQGYAEMIDLAIKPLQAAGDAALKAEPDIKSAVIKSALIDDLG